MFVCAASFVPLIYVPPSVIFGISYCFVCFNYFFDFHLMAPKILNPYEMVVALSIFIFEFIKYGHDFF
jgi:hypothetical protein